jgi:hypothetical protein
MILGKDEEWEPEGDPITEKSSAIKTNNDIVVSMYSGQAFRRSCLRQGRCGTTKNTFIESISCRVVSQT